MTIAEDVRAERATFADLLIKVGPSAPTGCGEWTALDLAAHLVGEERFGGVTTFVARSLVAGGLSVPATPRLVDKAMRMERRHGFTALVNRLRQPVPPLLLRPLVAPLTLFEYWTHHDDLIRCHNGVHSVPAALAEAVPLVLRYQLKKLPAGVRVTVGTNDGHCHWSAGPKRGPKVMLGGSPPDLIRWLSGRPAAGEITMTGPDATVQTLRAFTGRV
ncbi:maleylpyruvate isomerase family mycothiol-dependent enzyme [Mycolicibacterium neworleansense]|uniref:maleylpyruvate isomerase family mycothiol-dependent enzyme n=1 Tax=Mycolicibacterium neworleansense TaxID=146018 RepID=UPI001331783D|nr:maleylpyruvate isomerase family mycothiol-dependent enzyme [Mycolicibacterium neworleansense]MCV7363392.1 maleylpyruvate isomerase family mycothiol-dependent enzyme [Mycolicibacterium neworleansense]